LYTIANLIASSAQVQQFIQDKFKTSSLKFYCHLSTFLLIVHYSLESLFFKEMNRKKFQKIKFTVIIVGVLIGLAFLSWAGVDIELKFK
jgi:hypothetical protein